MIWGGKKKNRLSQKETNDGRAKREQLISDGQAMGRLVDNSDFKRFCELLEEEREGIRRKYEDKYTYAGRTNEEKISLVARINQINETIKKPSHVIWMMENMTEYREAIKEKTRVRQAHGNKIGGQV